MPMKHTNLSTLALAGATALGWVSGTAPTAAAPASYTIDAEHTYPSFEASHMGISMWRGKFDRTKGSVTVDRTAGSGEVEIVVDLSSVDFGHAKLNAFMVGPEFFDVANSPEARYHGTFAGFVNGAPTRVEGALTLHNVTKPLTLKVKSFKCIPDPMLKRERCGADAFATFQRDQFGLDAGKSYGFSMAVALQIQVEALKNN
jgi:polyisoprenoid-binding protein YceI